MLVAVTPAASLRSRIMEPESLTDADVSAVLATLPRLREDLEWTVGQRGGSKSGRLVWVRAVIPQGTVSTPDHLLLFDGRTYSGRPPRNPGRTHG